jgi:hypothetical protein
MLPNKTLLTAKNLNNAYVSKNDTNAQSISSNLTINGGQLTLKNSIVSDTASASYLKIDPQGNRLIVYDGVNNQELSVYSSSGSESVNIGAINGTTSFGQIDVSSAVNHLKIMNNTGKMVEFGGNIQLKDDAKIGRLIGSTTDEFAIYPYRNGLKTFAGGSDSPHDAGMLIASDSIIAFGETDGNKILGWLDTNSSDLRWKGDAIFDGTVEVRNGVNISGGSLIVKYVSDPTKSIMVGNGATDAFVTNTKSGKFLQLKDTGEFMYDSKLVWHEGTFTPNSKLDLAGGTMTGDLVIAKNQPWLTLDSPGTGLEGTDQASGISIGEGGTRGSAALHITYTGDGYGHIGMGIVGATTSKPQYEAMELFYTNNTVKFFATPNVNGSSIWHAGNDGASSGLDADLLDGQHGSYYRDWNNFTNKPSTFAPSAHTHTDDTLAFRDVDFGANRRLGTAVNGHSTPMNDLSDVLSHSLASAHTSDIFRFKNVVSIEYFNGTSWVAWSTTEWKNVLDGTANTYLSAPLAQKNFRLTIDLAGTWLRVAGIVIYQRYVTGEMDYSLTVEGSTDNATWRSRLSPTNSSGAKSHAIFITNDTQDDRYMRLTFDTPATDANRFELSNIIGITNRRENTFNGTGLPISWNYDKNITVAGNMTFSNKNINVNGGVFATSDETGNFTTNVDHIWHDDSGAGSNEALGTWNFVSDLNYKAYGNSGLRFGSFYAQSSGHNYIGGTLGIGTNSALSSLSIAKGDGADKGININGSKIDTSAGSFIIRNSTAIRFGDDDSWDWNKWAGMRYETASSTLTIGGPASSKFTSATSPPTVSLLFDGIYRAGINTLTPRSTLDVNGNISTPIGSSLYVGDVNDTGHRMRVHNNGVHSYLDYGLGDLYIRRGTTNFLQLTSGGALTVTGSQTVTGGLTVNGLVNSPATNAAAYRVGSNADVWDVNTANTMGIYGVQNSAIGAIKLGSTGPTLSGTSSSLDVNMDIKLNAGKSLKSAYNGTGIVRDHNNGNVTISAASGALYLGYETTSQVRLTSSLYHSNGTTQMIANDGTLYFQGQSTDVRYTKSVGDTMTGDITFSNKGQGIVGTYDAAKYRSIYSMGSSYKMATDGATLGTFYGLAMTHTNNTDGQAKSGLSHQILVVENGQTKTALGSGIWTSGNITMGAGGTLIGPYGTIARSTDEWLRLNDDGSHTSGVYLGSSIVRTDGSFQVGSSGANFIANSSGVTTSGDINMSLDKAINASGYRAIDFWGPADLGIGMAIGAGGTTIIGGGESAQTAKTALANTAGTEVLYLASDGEVKIRTDIQSGWGASKEFNFFRDGSVSIPGFDLKLGYGDTSRGNSGESRALVKATGNKLIINYGEDFSGATRVDGSFHVNTSADTSGDDNDGLVIGTAGGSRIGIDNNEISSYNGTSPDTLTLNADGGDVLINNSAISGPAFVYSAQKHLTWGTGNPSGGVDGDIYIQY